MTTFYTFSKPPGALGKTSLGLEFNLGGLASALTIYWLREQLDAAGDVISGGYYYMRLATDTHTIWFGQAPANDGVLILGAFPDSIDEPDLIILAVVEKGEKLTPETLASGKATITIMSTKYPE